MDGSAATQLQYSTAGGSTVGLSYMQALTPSLTLGGVGQYTLKKKTLQTGFGGIYDYKEHMFAAQYAMDSNVSTICIRIIFITLTDFTLSFTYFFTFITYVSF